MGESGCEGSDGDVAAGDWARSVEAARPAAMRRRIGAALGIFM